MVEHRWGARRARTARRAPATVWAMVAVLLTVPGPALVGRARADVPVGDLATVPVSIRSTSPEWARRVEWGLERFRIAGLTLPPMVITVHGSSHGCGGNVGLYRPEDPVEVHLCSSSHVDSRPARLIVLHEMAHAWAESQLTPDQRRSFVRHRGLRVWTDDLVPRHEWGAEHAAEITSWGLMDEQIPIVRIYDAEPVRLAAGFSVLVGRAPLWHPAAEM